MKFGDKVVFVGQVNETNIIDKLEKGMVGVVTSVSDNYEYPITVNFGDFDEQLCVEELELVKEEPNVNKAYAWNDVIQQLTEQHVPQKQDDDLTKDNLTVKQKLKLANSKLASIELILLDYYNGEFETIGDLAGAISYVLNGEEND